MTNICLLTIDLSTVGGINKITFDLANDLHSKNHNVIVCGLINGNKTPFYEHTNIKIINLFNDNLRLKEYLIPAIKKLKQILIEYDIQIVLAQGEAAAIISAMEKLVYHKCKYVFCDHGALTYPLSGFTKFSTYLTLLFCGHFNDYNIFETKRASEKFKKKYFCNKSTYIYNYTTVLPTNSTNISNNNTIVTVGRITPQKGYDLLIDVAKQVQCDYPWEWHIIGDGELYGQIKKEIISNNLENKVIMLGNINNIKDIYKNYYLMVCTSRHEGLPIALIDAKFAKVPIISFDIEYGPSEIIIDKQNGELIKPFDTSAMANRISYILKNNKLRNNYSNNSYLNIEQFKKKNIIIQWEKFINNILYNNNKKKK